MTPECEDENEFKAVPNQLGAPKDKECCDTETIRIVPDELREPVGSVPTEEVSQRLTPGPVVIGNRPVSVACEDEESHGDPVALPADYRTKNLYFSSVLSITDNVTQYIAKHGLEETITSRYRSGTLSAEELRTLTGMTVVQAREFLELAKLIQDDLTAVVLEIAKSQLQCYWMNKEQVAECSDPLMAHETDSSEAVFRAVVSAGKYISYLSQEDADQKAKDEAESLINCFYMNDPFTARCHERPNRPDEATEAVPNDTIPIYHGRTLRVGTVEVPANKFKSVASKEAANQMARDWGYSQLVCWYPNLIVSAECDDPDARNLGVSPENPAVAADIDKRTYGQSVYIPYGYFTSELSVEMATQEAEQLAETLLQCCYINHEIILRCADETVYLSDGTQATIKAAPAPMSPMPYVHVAAGAYTSCISQEDADTQAEMSVEGMLQCRYCSLAVMPSCVPEWVLDGVKQPENSPNHISLPLIEGHIGNSTHQYVSSASFPMNATRGLQEGAVCDSNAQTAQQMANMLGRLPITGEFSGDAVELCTYYNDLVIVACATDDPYGGYSSQDGEAHYGVTDTNEPYYFYSKYSTNACLYEEMTSPKPGNVISAPAGMFSDQGSDKKQELNERAIEWATSLLQCWFTNPPIKAACYGFTAHHGTLCDAEWTLSTKEVDPDAEHNPINYLEEWSNTQARPIIIPQGQILFQGIDANEAAQSVAATGINLAQSQVLCMFGNYQVTDSTCMNHNVYSGPEGGGDGYFPDHQSVNKIYAPVTVNAKTFIAEDVEGATQAALRVVQGSSFCYTDDWITYYYGGNMYSSSDAGGGGGGIRPPGQYSSSEQTGSTFPQNCTISFQAFPRKSGQSYYIDASGFAIDNDGIDAGEVVVTNTGPFSECAGTIEVSCSIPGTNCTGHTSVTIPCASSSSNAGSTGLEGCYYNCPNFVGETPWSDSPMLDKTSLESFQSKFMLWENDAAANYELLSAELAQLERQIQILEAQL